METRANYLLIGAFTLAGFLGLLGFLMWFARFEVDRQFDYYDVHFTEVSGLGVASQVRFSGLPVGQVVDMGLSPSGDGTVRVRIEIRQGTPVRTDSTAALEMQGVTGVANIGISAGSPNAPLLRDTVAGIPEIEASRSILQTLGDQGPQMIERLNTVAEQLTQLLGDENQGRVAAILENVERSSGNLDQAIADVSAATGAIASAAEHIAGFGEQLGGLGDAATATLGRADVALDKFTESAGVFDATLGAATGTLDTVERYIAADLTRLTAQLDDTVAQAGRDFGSLSERAGQSLTQLDGALEGAGSAIDAATRAFDGADRMLNTDIGPVISDLRGTLGTANDAIAQLGRDLPGITDRIGQAADSAARAFGGMNDIVAGASGPFSEFSQEGLPQLTRLSRDLRGLVDNLNQLITGLRRNPSQIITGPQSAPEFRR